MIRPRPLLYVSLRLLAFLSLVACMPAPPTVPPPGIPAAPPGAPEGTCWHRNISPAVIETVTEQVIVRPAERDAAGNILKPATFRTVTRQDIIRPRSDSWIETPCPEQMTPGFIASVQRALAARGYYQEPITGRMDASTRISLRRYQKEAGLDSSALSLDTARQLGLIAVIQ